MSISKKLGMATAIALLASTSAYAGSHGGKANMMGRTVGVTCAGCHGTDGVSKGAAPSLKGLPEEHLVNSMMMFKNGKRPSSIMQRIAKGYTDGQIKAVAAYFSNMK